MNQLHWIIYLIRFALYLLLSFLFRIYLLLVFFAKDAAPTLVLFILGGLVYLFRGWASPMLANWFAPILSIMNDHGRAADPWHLPVVTVIALVGVYITLSVIGGTLRYLLTAFPFPQRPLPPVRRWTPPKHRIRNVRCTVTVPRLKLRYWDGNQRVLARRLPTRLRQLITSEQIGSHNAETESRQIEKATAAPTSYRAY